MWWTGDGGQVEWSIYGFASQWLPASLLEDDAQERQANALFASSRHWEVELQFNKGLAGAAADAIQAAKDTATNPAVLDAFALAIIAAGTQHAYPGIPGHEPDVLNAQKQAAAVDQAMGESRKIASPAASYVSESNFFESSWQQSFWGSNYPRLQAVKAKYDPDGLFLSTTEWAVKTGVQMASRG